MYVLQLDILIILYKIYVLNATIPVLLAFLILLLDVSLAILRSLEEMMEVTLAHVKMDILMLEVLLVANAMLFVKPVLEAMRIIVYLVLTIQSVIVLLVEINVHAISAITALG